VLDGLEVIHDRAILHRDLKPNNVMLREDGAPVIIDFGAARDFQARHSRSITSIATAGYSPPEQYGVGGEQGPWSDLYALGAIAYRAVSGVPPVDSLRRLRKDPLVPAVVAAAGKYDEALLRTIDWMLKIDEEERPGSVAQAREALRGVAIAEVGRDAKAQAPVPSDASFIQPSGTARPSSRGRGIAIAIGLLVLASLAAGSYAFHANYRTKQQAVQQAKQNARQEAELQAKQQAERQIQQANERQRLLAEQLASAGTDQSKLEQFLAACGSDCPDGLRTQALARIDTAKQQQRQAERQIRLANERRQLLAEQLASIGTDQSKLERFLADCGATCPEALRAQAQARIDTAKQQQRQTELARQDEAAYRAARGDIAKLRTYDTSCTVCTFRDGARSEIASIEQQQRSVVERKLQANQQSTDGIAHPPRPRSEAETCADRLTASGTDHYCASSRLPPQFGNSYGVRNLYVGGSSEAWVEGVSGYGIGEWIVVEFDGRRSVRSLLIDNGYQKNADIYYKNSRVKRVRLVFSSGETFIRALDDKFGTQKIILDKRVSAYWVQIVVEDVYRGSKYSDTAISKLFVNSDRQQ
jgi:hypothetical protein